MDIESLLNPVVQANSEPSNPNLLNFNRLNGIPRPGRQSRSISERSPINFGKPWHRIKCSYSREFKIKVLEWWLHHRIELNSGSSWAPLLKEVSARYLVPISTLQSWRVKQDKIILSKKGTRKCSPPASWCQWPELEAHLYQKYQKRREERKAVWRSWLIRQARESFSKCYPLRDPEAFHFSDGWFFGSLRRHSISLRFATNKLQKIPENYLQSILSWLRFNRRNSQLRLSSPDEEGPVGRYLLDRICNVDETPLPFEFLNGQTYADKGSHSVQVKACNSGWDKRQATLVLTIFGSSKPRVRPLIIFKGKEKYEGRKSQFYLRKRVEEMGRYDGRVEVRWNETAYANSDLLVDWINNLLVPALPSGPRLLALDVAKFHSTERVLSTLRSHDIIPSLIPPGCTGLVQLLDVSVNKPFKSLLRDILDDLLDQYEDRHHLDLREIQKKNTSAIAEHRVLVTQAVGEAWEQFCERHQELVVQTFWKLGLTLPIDGSSDEELLVKGIDSSLLEIGDWRRAEYTSTTLGEADRSLITGETGPEDLEIEFVNRE